MCGIFGFVSRETSNYREEFLAKSLKELGSLSVRRGKDSSGLCGYNQERHVIDLIKGPFTITELFKKKEVENSITDWCKKGNDGQFAFGHSRLVTNGTQLDHNNNQPIYKDDIFCVHNGIVVNVDELWQEHPEMLREFEIDSEVLISLTSKYLSENISVEDALSKSISNVFGTVSTAMLINDQQKLVLATNNGSLYIITNDKDILFFGSEHYIMTKFKENSKLDNIGKYKLKQIKSGHGLSIDLETFSFKNFLLSESAQVAYNESKSKSLPVRKIELDPDEDQLSTVMDLNEIHLNPKAAQETKLLEYPIDEIKKLKRCSNCLLPSTFPYIQFDGNGVCNYCNNYTKQNRTNSMGELEKLVEPYRKDSNKPEVLIPISGGRDSTYVLHSVVKDLGLNAISYTYDWGMVTDLARRNIARICGKLGVENIIVAADIHWKRNNIKKNIQAWLKNPELGMIPLFMAGDKFFFYHAYKIKKELGIDLEIWGVNDLENTNFKTGFAGLKPEFEKERIYSLSLRNKLKLFGFVGKNIVKSSGYINQSMLDSLGSFGSRYFIPKADYYHLYDYIRWDEELIENTLFFEYDWEKAVDTDSTWRIGDGTASFYNYIYTRVAGFSENDTFRSNQIREGMISRQDALNLIYEENSPRYNSLKWYLEIVGLDFEEVIQQINKIPPIILGMNYMPKLYAVLLVLFLFLGVGIEVNAQSETDSYIHSELRWFVSSSFGIQMSGIKSEDFVKSNYSPLVNITVGKWFSTELALQFGYRGIYFNAISDDVKHHYNYFFGDVILDLNNLLLRKEVESVYKPFLHIGSGYFYNYYYGQPNILGSIAFSNHFQIHKEISLKFDISALMGWDIYQGDEDILPGVSIGISYYL